MDKDNISYNDNVTNDYIKQLIEKIPSDSAFYVKVFNKDKSDLQIKENNKTENDGIEIIEKKTDKTTDV